LAENVSAILAKNLLGLNCTGFALARSLCDETLSKIEVVRSLMKCALAVIDIDNFKNVNDTYGHLAGDKVLKEFVQIIKNNLRKEDMIARWGGEEFLVFLNCDDKETILQKFEHMRQLIDGHTFTTIDRLTASFGLTLSRNGDTVDTIYKRADEALYQAKKLGKNRVVYH